MIVETKFPDVVTNDSDQSRTLGRELQRLLAGKTPRQIIAQQDLLANVIFELWHNLPCLTDECVLRCLPIYVAYKDSERSHLRCASRMPPSSQVNEELLEVLAGISFQTQALAGIGQLFDEGERKSVTLFLEQIDQTETVDVKPVLEALFGTD